MIIIPTEKRFDWKHAPIVLFSLVLLNIFIYFIPQSGDNEIVGSSFVEYKKQNYLLIEWPFLKTYLEETEQIGTLEKLNTLFNEQQYDQVIGHILFDAEFYRYLRQDQYDYFRNNRDVGDWFFIREQINDAIQSTTMVSYGVTPSNLSFLSLISYQFMHGSVMHLLGNLFFLIICGFAVEAALGHWRFLGFYLIAGVVGGLLHALVYSKSPMPLVGASGAISGTMAMYLALFRLKKIEFFYWFFVFVGYFRAPALFILLFYIGKELFQLFSDTQSNTAFLAHIGGFVAGGILMGATYWYNRALFNHTGFNEDYIEEDQSIDPLQEKKATVYEFLGKYQFDAAEKAIERIRQDDSNDFDFELALIRYNIEKIEKKKGFNQHLVELLSHKKLTEKQAQCLETIWQENEERLGRVDTGLGIKLATNLAEANPPKQASLLFDQFYSELQSSNTQKYQTPLAVLAKKIADSYERSNNLVQQKRFTDIKNELVARKA
ncbi:MAG: rhomboid family intramembrane serine protease [Cellvibrionaceae bacterium]